MKKADLKVGETYACYTRPTREGTWHYRYNKPFKATLVSLGGTAEYGEREMVRADGETFTKKFTKNGIIVKLAEPYVRKNRKYDWVGGYSNKSEKALLLLAPKEDGGFNEEVEVTIEEIALENGGCFRSTWAEYEKEVKAEEERKERFAREHKQRVDEERAGHDANVERLHAVRARLTEVFGGEVDHNDYYRSLGGYQEGRQFSYGNNGHGVELEVQYGNRLSKEKGEDDRAVIGWNLEVKSEEALDKLLGITS